MQKKIAFVVESFGGSSTSLIEAFLKSGYNVDFYHLARRGNTIGSYETFDYKFISRIGELKKLNSLDFDGLRRFTKYAARGRFSMFHITGLGINKTGIRRIFNPLARYFLNKFVTQILSKKYDFVNVVGLSWSTVTISKILNDRGINVTHSMHEICANHLNGNKLDDKCSFLLRHNIKINVFSEKSANDLISLSGGNKIRFSVIPFSLFTGYMEYADTKIAEIAETEDYVLFYGFLRDYKGLNILYQASKMFNKEIVIAGGGYVPVLEKVKLDNSFIVINRWLQNAEIATLVRHCHVIVCPYLSSSQTGITQTAFCFDKPIVASRVPAFVSTIENEKTGLLVDVGDETKFAAAINRTYVDSCLYNNMCKNIRIIRKNSDNSWRKIVNMYVDEYLK